MQKPLMQATLIFAASLSMLTLVPGVRAQARTEKTGRTQTNGKKKMTSEISKPILLWSGKAPGEQGDIGEERDMTKPQEDAPGHYVSRIGNVTQPTITLYRPKKETDTGAAVVVCPGGGYSILAYDLEGSEVCEWLNSIGVTGILLKYRVPSRSGLEKHTASLQDAQRALSVVRHRSEEWRIDPNRIGILGFSAGGHLSVMASSAYDVRTYPETDAADRETCRPDFSILIYPAYLTQPNDLTRLADEIKVTERTPSAFIAMTQDDPVHAENAFVYALALKGKKVPFELHMYPVGGHGYGLRSSANLVSHWPERAAEWLKSQGLLAKPPHK